MLHALQLKKQSLHQRGQLLLTVYLIAHYHLKSVYSMYNVAYEINEAENIISSYEKKVLNYVWKISNNKYLSWLKRISKKQHYRCCRSRDGMAVGFTSTYVFPLRTRCRTSCDKVGRWHVAGRWFPPGTPAFSPNKTDGHDMAEILKVALIAIKPKSLHLCKYCTW